LKKQYNIKVLGQDFLIQSDKGDGYVERVVQFVNEKAQELGSNAKNVTTLGVSILVALNITEEYLQLRDDYETLRDQCESKAERLIHFIQEKKGST